TSFGALKEGTIRAIQTNDAGQVFVAGTYRGTISFGGETATSDAGSMFVVAFSPEGERVWSSIRSDMFESGFNGIAVDSTGDLVLAGYYRGKLDLGCGFLAAPQDDMAACGDSVETTCINAAIARLDARDGSCRWSFGFGGHGESRAEAVSASRDGAVLLGG